MDRATQLLRMLEPVTRPGNLPGPSRLPSEPVESRSFESLLEEAQGQGQDGPMAAPRPAVEPPEDDAPAEPAPARPDLLRPLGGTGVIENAALRELRAAMADRTSRDA